MLLLKNVKIIDPTSSKNGSISDVLIQNGKIKKIAKSIIEAKAKIIEHKNLHISPMWMDVGVFHGEPGNEHREDRDSLTDAAIKGGYGAIVGMPNTNPTIDDKSSINYYLTRATREIVDSYIFGAITNGTKGEHLAEMYDMHTNGAIGFTDGDHYIDDPDVLLKALDYVKAWDGIVLQIPAAYSVSKKGYIHEGEMSTRLGLVGMPSVYEKISINRDIELNNYADSRIHFLHVSNKEGIEEILKAKKKNPKISFSLSVMNLFFTDGDLFDFNVNMKTMPPLREKSDQKAMIKALKNGDVEFISTNHKGIDEEGKNLEFPYADFGAIGLETGYAAINTVLAEKISQEEIVELLAIRNRKLLKLDIPSIEEGKLAKLTLFSPDIEWTFNKNDIVSKSKNSPFVGSKFIGKALGVINGRKRKLFL